MSELKNIKWESRHVGGHANSIRNPKDVNVSITQKTGLTISFHKRTLERIALTGYLVFALDEEDDLIYFKPAQANGGWKLTKTPKSSSRMRIRVQGPSFYEKYKDAAGAYDLQYHTGLGLFFIDLMEGKVSKP